MFSFKRSENVRLYSQTMYWGLDIGGTKLEGVVLSEPSEHGVLLRERIATEADKGYDHVLERCKLLLDKLISESKSEPTILGVAHPGKYNFEQHILSNSNTTALNGRPFIRDLEEKLGVALNAANDANCFTLAEAKAGGAKDFQTVFGIIVGTGVGGALCVDGKILQGRHGIAGEWGHNILEQQGAKCYCGKRGCVETVISGPALENYYRSIAGGEMALADIAAAAETDDHAATTLRRLYKQFGKALAAVINIFDPDCIIVGGGVSNIDGIYSEGRDAILPYLFNDRFETPLVKHSLGDSAGVIGAALLTA